MISYLLVSIALLLALPAVSSAEHRETVPDHLLPRGAAAAPEDVARALPGENPALEAREIQYRYTREQAKRAPLRIGGDDVYVDSGEIGPVWAHQSDARPNGEIYMAVREDAPSPGIRVKRSVDGGAHWGTYGFISAPAGHTYASPSIHVADGTTNYLYVAFENNPPTGSISIDVARLDLSSVFPIYSITTAITSPASAQRPSLISDHDAYSGYYLYLAAQNGFGEILFTRSIDLGNSWAPSYLIGDGPTGLRYATPQLSYGSGGLIHAAWSVTDNLFSDMAMRYRQAVGFADAGAAAWSTVVAVTPISPTELDRGVTAVAASKVSGQVVIMGTEGNLFEGGGFIPTGTEAQYSSDGISWASAPGLESVRALELLGASNSDECAMLVLDGDDHLLSTTTSPASGWSVVGAFNDTPASSWTDLGSLVYDVSRGNRWGMFSQQTSGTTRTVYFDSQWLSDPGFANGQPGFPIDLPFEPISAPALVDMNGNGQDEIVFGLQNGEIWVVDAFGSMLPGWPVNVGSLVDSPIAIGDLNGDGKPTVVAGDQTGNVWAFDATGQLESGFPYAMPQPSPVHVSIGALGGPYPRTIVAGGGTRFVFLNYRGESEEPLERWETLVPIDYPAAIGDVDGDGIAEVVGCAGPLAFVFKPSATAANWVTTMSADVSGSVTLGDLDANGSLEILVPLESGELHAFTGVGSNYGVGWPFMLTGAGPMRSAALVNMTGSTDLEIVVASDQSQISALGRDGLQLSGYPIHTGIFSQIPGAPIVDRIDASGPDVLAGTNFGQAFAWDETGTSIDGWPQSVGGSVPVSQAVGDIDGDGANEVVVLSLTKLFVYDVSSLPETDATRRWPMAGYDPQRTGCVACTEDVATGIEPGLGTRISMAAPYPNPTNSTSVFRFTLPDPAVASLKVFDLRGRLVRTLRTGQLGAGDHAVNWDGQDTRGHKLASGVYLVRLQAGSETQSRRITLQR